MTDPAPPSWLRRLVRRLLPGEYGDDFLADLDEGFGKRARGRPVSRIRAVCWYLGQVVRPDTWRLAMRLRARRRRHPASCAPSEGRRIVGLPGRLRDDVEAALRSLARNPAYTLLASATLALGLGATTAVLSAMDSVLLHPFPYDATERMYAFRWNVGIMGYSAGPDQIQVLSEQTDLFEGSFRGTVDRQTLTGAGPVELVSVGLTQARTLRLLGIHPLLGRRFTDQEARGEGARVVLLAHDVWRSRFGSDPGVLGQTVSLSGDPWMIIGVMPPHTPFPVGFESDVELWAPLPDAKVDRSQFYAIARPGVSREGIQARLDVIAERAIAEGQRADRWTMSAISVADRVGASVAEPLRILMAAVVLVLLIALVNVANLLLSRATLRRSETAVRSAVGASRVRLVRQLLLEALLLAGIGTALGVALAYGATEAVRALRPAELAVMDQIHVDRRVLGWAVGIGFLGAILFGTLPAWQGWASPSLAALRSAAAPDREGVAARRARWLLLGGEVALSFALLVGSFMAVRALVELQRRNLGFHADGLVFVSATLPAWEYEDDELREATRERLRTLIERRPGVAEVSIGELPTVVGFYRSVAPRVEGTEPHGEPELIATNMADAALFRLLGLPILQGRAFTQAEVRDEAPVAVLGERTADALFGGEPALGRRFRYGPVWYTVVGVAGEVDLDRPDVPLSARALQVYHPGTRSRGTTYVVRLAPDADARSVLDGIARDLRTEVPDLLLPIAATARDLFAERVARERFTSTLLTGFGVLALLLALVGLYGVVSSLVGQRTREIGIRVSLGADHRAVRRLVLGEGGTATTLGILGGSLLSWAGLRTLSSQIFGLDPGRLASASLATAVVLVLTSLVACWAPLRRALRVDPVVALREE